MAAPFGTMLDFGDTVTSNVIEWNAGVRAIDMHPTLVHLSPMSTVTFGLFEETDLESATPEWLQRTLATIDSDNAVTEAADYTYTDENVPARVQQVVRHQRKTAQVSGRAMHDKVFNAVADLKRDQIETRALELRRDMNHALINSQLSLSDEATASRFRGILQSLSTAGNTADADDVQFNGGLIDEANFKDNFLKEIYDDGFEPDTVITPPRVQSEIIDTFTTSNTKFIEAEAKKQVSHVNVYDSPFGRVQIVMERSLYLSDIGDTAAGTLIGLQRDMFQIGYYRRTWMEEPPRDGDRWRGVMQVEWALKDLAGQAGYSITDIDGVG